MCIFRCLSKQWIKKKVFDLFHERAWTDRKYRLPPSLPLTVCIGLPLYQYGVRVLRTSDEWKKKQNKKLYCFEPRKNVSPVLSVISVKKKLWESRSIPIVVIHKYVADPNIKEICVFCSSLSQTVCAVIIVAVSARSETSDMMNYSSKTRKCKRIGRFLQIDVTPL